MDIGERAPEFSLPDQHGQARTLNGLLADGPLVLFFYPAAMSAGCTVQSCHFRDLAAEFAAFGAHGAQCAGISTDSVERQAEFDTAHHLGYPLLSDADGAVAKAYGAKRTLPVLSSLVPTRRQTFVIGAEGTVLAVVHSETKMNVHADEALETLKAYRRE